MLRCFGLVNFCKVDPTRREIRLARISGFRHSRKAVVFYLSSPAALCERNAGVSSILKSYFVSESSVYSLLKVHDLITNPAFVVIKATDEF